MNPGPGPKGTDPKLLGAGNGRQAPITIKVGTRGERGWEGALFNTGYRHGANGDGKEPRSVPMLRLTFCFAALVNATIAYTGRNVAREASKIEKRQRQSDRHGPDLHSGHKSKHRDSAAYISDASVHKGKQKGVRRTSRLVAFLDGVNSGCEVHFVKFMRCSRQTPRDNVRLLT
eukprot:scaffold889_cov33-Attheya_sp.AAC.1